MLTYPVRRRLRSYLPPEATLILDFGARRALVAGKQVDLQSISTFARAGTAWAVGDGGVLREYPAAEMRLIRPGTGAAGVVMERGATNLFFHSRDMSQSVWSRTSMTVSSAVGIDGKSGNRLLTDSAAAGATRGAVSQVRGVSTDDQWITASVYVRQRTGDRLRAYLGLSGGTSLKGGEAVFDTDIGAVLTAQSDIVARLAPGPLGFIRLVMSVRNTVAASACVMELSRESNAGDPISFIADFWQMEYGSQASSPISTGAGAATRAGENLTIGSFSDWFNATEGTLYVEGTIFGAAENNRSIVRLAGGTSSLGLGIGAGTNSLDAISIVDGAVQGSGGASGYASPPRRIRAAVRYKAGDFAFSVTGMMTPFDGESLGHPRVIPLTGATDVPAYGSLSVGSISNTNQADGVISKLIYIPYALDDERLAAAVL